MKKDDTDCVSLSDDYLLTIAVIFLLRLLDCLELPSSSTMDLDQKDI